MKSLDNVPTLKCCRFRTNTPNICVNNTIIHLKLLELSLRILVTYLFTMFYIFVNTYLLLMASQ